MRLQSHSYQFWARYVYQYRRLICQKEYTNEPPEHCANLSKASRNSDDVKAYAEARRGVPRTPETCDAIKKGLKNSKAAKAYHEAQRGVKHTPEACSKMSVTHTDVPLSPEHSAAIKEGHKESEADKAAADVMRGGNDLVIHHYIYDHNDLSLNIVQMTRSDHTSLHNLLRKLGYKVPHINEPKGL